MRHWNPEKALKNQLRLRHPPEKTQPEGIEPAPQPAQIEKKEEIIEERREELVQPQPETTPESEPAATAHPLSEAQHEEVEKEIPQESTKKDFSRVEAGMFLEQVLTRSNRGFLIDISGADGIGKSTIISNLAKTLQTGNLYGWSAIQSQITANFLFFLQGYALFVV